jgi:hypothetical protein
MPDGLEANGVPRPRARVFLREAVREESRVCQRRQVGHFAHLVNEDYVWFEDRWMVASLCDE